MRDPVRNLVKSSKNLISLSGDQSVGVSGIVNKISIASTYSNPNLDSNFYFLTT